MPMMFQLPAVILSELFQGPALEGSVQFTGSHREAVADRLLGTLREAGHLRVDRLEAAKQRTDGGLLLLGELHSLAEGQVYRDLAGFGRLDDPLTLALVLSHGSPLFRRAVGFTPGASRTIP